MRLNDTILGVLILALGLAIVVGAQLLPAMPGQDVGPGLFPTMIGAGFIACGAFMAFRARKEWRTLPLRGVADWRGDPRKIVAVIWLVGGLMVYIAAFDWIGFIVLSMIYTGGLMIILGVRALAAFGWSLGTTFFVFELFTRLLYVPLPGGILGNIG
ncbi:MAG: tripartite tricarboxylate transporter TctB family protein [Rhodospirillales bacterium]|jgi:putative tricarboxylic transport membrane protein|nr:tripartite tricarboxylate transporter TctB family protein [Rhodospirillales bacterium]